MTGDGYNGWPTYETWAVALWLGNDEETQRDVEHIAAAWNILSGDEGGTLAELADEIARYVDDLTEIESVRQRASLASDLLGAALSDVDWQALARAYAAELADEAELARRQRRYLDRLARR